MKPKLDMNQQQDKKTRLNLEELITFGQQRYDEFINDPMHEYCRATLMMNMHAANIRGKKLFWLSWTLIFLLGFSIVVIITQAIYSTRVCKT